MKHFRQNIYDYSGKDLEYRKSWYSPSAAAYNKLRPRYPEVLMHRVVEVTNLSHNSTILEVGCGPGTATVAFAQFGGSTICLEPNPDFCLLARQNCEQYPNVEIQNISFEEWPLEAEKFDAVLAATSFHWIDPEIGYPKAANALRGNGHLILLWNKELQPSYEVYQSFSEVYQVHAPSLSHRYEDRATQKEILRELGQIALASGKFKDLISEHFECEVTYSVNDYLLLLSTYSPYLKLDKQSRDSVFNGLRGKIEQDLGGRIQLSYLSTFHISRKL
jgi:SAM-dependent methyltransferase